jgi:hypothetical protein
VKNRSADPRRNDCCSIALFSVARDPVQPEGCQAVVGMSSLLFRGVSRASFGQVPLGQLDAREKLPMRKLMPDVVHDQTPLTLPPDTRGRADACMTAGRAPW